MKKKKASKPDGYVFGRPTLYSPDLCEKIIKYFDQPLYLKKKKVVSKAGVPIEIEVEVPNSLPTFEGFAKTQGTSHQTLFNWTKKHSDFFDAYRQCKDIQKIFIVEHGLMGGYNPAFAKFIALNVTDLREVVNQVDENGNVITLKYNLDDK